MKNKSAFTLGELLIVIAIVAILAALLLPVLSSVTAKSKQAKCASNLKQIYTATVLFTQDNNGWIPYNLNDTYSGWTWVEAIVPYLEKLPTKQGVRPASVLACPASTKQTRAGEYSDYGKNLFVNENKNDPNPWSPPKFNMRMINLAAPSKTMAFADGANRDLSVWNGDFGMAYRHTGYANIVYYDGHIEPMLQKNMPGAGGDDIYKYPWSGNATR